MPLDQGDDSASTLFEVWERHAREHPQDTAVVCWRAGEEPHRWRWHDLLQQALKFASALQSRGVGRGDVCALVLRHQPDFYPLYMAIEALGALPAVLAYPNPRLHPDKFRSGLAGMARRSGLDWVLTEADLHSTVAPLVTGSDSTIRGILLPLDWPLEPGAAAADPTIAAPRAQPGDDPCLLQHSSGTTGLQKAVVLSHRAVLQHVRHYGAAIGLSPLDKVVSWLPLYHDMGLIAAFHMPLAFGIPTIQIDPFEWVTMPALLLQAAALERATLTWLPNFAYNHTADRVHDDELEGVRLDSLRMVINCSEPVRLASHERFIARFGAHGLRRAALAACYAMAETTFAATQTPPGHEAPSLEIARPGLAAGHARDPAKGEVSSRLVSSGRAISGCELRVVDGERRPLPDRKIGEIAIRSISMFDGYRGLPEKTSEVLQDGWFYTGDYGFTTNGEWYVVGRKKDLIIVAGKNLYPEDIEDAVAAVPGVLTGRVVAFGLDDETTGTESVCVVAETDAPEEQRSTLRLDILRAGMTIDVTISRVYLVEPRWLIKSSAGKPSRAANRERALASLEPAV